MDNFLQKFFPNVAQQAQTHTDQKTDAYCTYSDIRLQLFTSSLFLAAAFAGLAGSFTTRYVLITITTLCHIGVQSKGLNVLVVACNRAWGRIRTMTAGGACFCLGAILTATAHHIVQLIIGRVILGLGVGMSP